MKKCSLVLVDDINFRVDMEKKFQRKSLFLWGHDFSIQFKLNETWLLFEKLDNDYIQVKCDIRKTLPSDDDIRTVNGW